MPDWVQWLDRYDSPGSPLRQRLSTVQRLIGKELDRTAPAAVSILSICAGDGRDVIELLAERGDAARVRATLVELDWRLCAMTRARVRGLELPAVEIRRADAGITDTYEDLDPADVVIVVGVFGNMADADMCSTIAALAGLCKREALVIWARRNEDEPIAIARETFSAEGFDETYASRFNAVYYVGAHRLAREPIVLSAGSRFFTFNNDGAGGRADAG